MSIFGALLFYLAMKKEARPSPSLCALLLLALRCLLAAAASAVGLPAIARRPVSILGALIAPLWRHFGASLPAGGPQQQGAQGLGLYNTCHHVSYAGRSGLALCNVVVARWETTGSLARYYERNCCLSDEERDKTATYRDRKNQRPHCCAPRQNNEETIRSAVRVALCLSSLEL